MTELKTTKELIVGLLSIGCVPDVDALFGLIVDEAPRLVGAEECSIFWKNDLWREPYRQKVEDVPEAFYRRATYAAKKHLIGVTYYEPGEGLTGWVIKHGQPLRINFIKDKDELEKIGQDTHTYDLKGVDKGGGYEYSEDRDRQRAFLAVPVRINQEIVGVIRIAKTIEPFGTFSQESQELLEAFADNIATIIRRVEEADLKAVWEKLYLSGISLKKDDFVNYLQRIADEIPKYLGAKACSIFLAENVGKTRILRLRATTQDGPLSNKIGEAAYDWGEGLTGWVAKHNQSLRISNVDDENELKRFGNDLKHKGKHEEYRHKNERSSFLASPIRKGTDVGSDVYGVIRIAQSERGRYFSQLDKDLLEYFCNNLAVLVENVSLLEDLLDKKEADIVRLRNNLNQLQQLSKVFKEDVVNIQKSLTELLPDTHDKVIKIGPVIITNRPRDKRKVFIGLPFKEKYTNLYEYAIEPALKELDLTPWIAAEQKSVVDIMSKIFTGIQECHIGIVDISDWNANVLFELGILYAQDHPVILLKDEDAEVPADLAGMEYLKYNKFKVLKEELVEYLTMLLMKADNIV